MPDRVLLTLRGGTQLREFTYGRPSSKFTMTGGSVGARRSGGESRRRFCSGERRADPRRRYDHSLPRRGRRLRWKRGGVRGRTHCAGQDASPHSHDRYEETIYGLQGVSTWTVEDAAVGLGPGEALCIPRGAVHHFDNCGKADAKALAIVTPKCSVTTELTPGLVADQGGLGGAALVIAGKLPLPGRGPRRHGNRRGGGDLVAPTITALSVVASTDDASRAPYRRRTAFP